jgi:hypothetical protein
VDPDAVIDALKSTPASLRLAVRRLKAAQIAQPAGDDWSALDVVRHVRAADAILAPRIWHALVRDRPALPSFDERRWAELIASANVPVDAQLAAFAIHRAELTALLRTLTPDQWQRTGVHETNGDQTVLQMCTHIAEHEREHVAQIEAIVRGHRV